MHGFLETYASDLCRLRFFFDKPVLFGEIDKKYRFVVTEYTNKNGIREIEMYSKNRNDIDDIIKYYDLTVIDDFSEYEIIKKLCTS